MLWTRFLGVLLMLGSSALAQEAFPPINELTHSTHVKRTVRYSAYYEYQVCKEDSTTLFGIVAELRRAAKATNDRELDFEADLLRAHYFFCSYTLDTEIILAELNATLKKAEDANCLWLRVRVESMLGLLNCYRLKRYLRGLIHLTHAANLMDDQSSSEYPLKQVCNYHVGYELSRIGDYSNALTYMTKAVNAKVPDSIRGHSFQLYNAFRTMHLYNSLGLTHRKMNSLEASDSCFIHANQLAIELSDTSWVAITSGNLGENHFLRGELNEAYPLLLVDATMAQKISDWDLASNALTLMGDIRLKQGAIHTADSLLNMARKYAYRSNDYKRLQVLYPRLAKLYVAKGNADLAQTFIDSSLFVNDSLERVSNFLRSARAEQKVQIENFEAMAEEHELERSYQIMLRNSIIVMLFLLIVIAALLFNRHRLKVRERQLELVTERIQGQERLDEAIKRLSAFALYADKNVDEKSLSDGVQLLEDSIILTDKNWRDFSETFESVHPGFFQRLGEKFPELTPAEIRFMVLTRLQFSVKEMAAVLGVSGEAIRQMRYRIKKKLHCLKDDDLGDLMLTV
jgi:tetratricopeptide (TPR) repeat protein